MLGWGGGNGMNTENSMGDDANGQITMSANVIAR